MSPQAPTKPGEGGPAVAAFCLLAYAAMAMRAVWTVPFPNAYDELAHLSFLVHLAHNPLARLDLDATRLLRPGLGGGFGPLGNYLNHPPVYYLALGWLLPADGWPTLHTVHAMRLANALLSTAAVGFALAVGVLRRLDLRLMLVFGVAVVLVPVMQVTGSGISNDNLALFGGCGAVLGAQAMPRARRSGLALLLAGCALATLAKFTAALMMGSFAAAVLLLQPAAWPRRLALLAALATVEAVAAVPYLWFTLRFGTPVPVTPAFLAVGAEAAAQHMTVNGWQPGAILSLPAYAGHFARWLLANWSPVLGIGGWAEAAILLGPGLMLLAAAPAFILNAPGRQGRDTLLAAGGTALLLTLVPHLVFSWLRYHVPLGAPPFDATPRYYLPCALAVLPAASCWTMARLPPWGRVAAPWLLLLALLAALPILAACHEQSCP